MRIRFVLVVLMVSVGVLARTASAQEMRTCPHAASGFEAFQINDPGWTLEDPVPALGDEPLWDLVLAGFDEANLTLQEAAEVFGFERVDELYASFLSFLLFFDRNGDFTVCVQRFPEVSQLAPYLFNFIDNSARVP